MSTSMLSVDLKKLFTEELELCEVTSDEKVVVLSEPGSREEYAAAGFGAAHDLGADVMHLQVPGGSAIPFPVVKSGSGYGLEHLHDLARQTLREADFVLDVTLEGYIHTPVLKDILRAGTRVLLACETEDSLRRNMPVKDDKRIAAEGAALIAGAQQMLVTSDAGTRLEVDVRDSNPGYQCGFTDEPGRWDHWPSKMVLCWPRVAGVHGQIVLQPGDILFPHKEYVRDAITMEIEAGRVTKISGGHDADRLRQFIEEGNDDNGWLTSHMGWGLLHSATWSSLGLYSKESVMGMEGRCVAGNFMISTGPNPYEERWTHVHTDLPMQRCNVDLDGRRVVDAGRVVA